MSDVELDDLWDITTQIEIQRLWEKTQAHEDYCPCVDCQNLWRLIGE